jgi:hypothetical protein
VVVASKTNRALDVIKAKWDAAIGYPFGISHRLRCVTKKATMLHNEATD